jgi:hypothetical protein
MKNPKKWSLEPKKILITAKDELRQLFKIAK